MHARVNTNRMTGAYSPVVRAADSMPTISLICTPMLLGVVVVAGPLVVIDRLTGNTVLSFSLASFSVAVTVADPNSERDTDAEPEPEAVLDCDCACDCVCVCACDCGMEAERTSDSPGSDTMEDSESGGGEPVGMSWLFTSGVSGVNRGCGLGGQSCAVVRTSSRASWRALGSLNLGPAATCNQQARVYLHRKQDMQHRPGQEKQFLFSQFGLPCKQTRWLSTSINKQLCLRILA